MARRLCGNLNHRRTDAPVRHCPQPRREPPRRLPSDTVLRQYSSTARPRPGGEVGSMETPGLEVRRRRGHALPGAVGVADFEPMLQTPPLVIDAEDDHEGRRILRDANLVRAQVILQVEPDHALAVRMSLPLNLPSHAPPFASPCVTHGAVRGCVRGALPGCASPVLAIGGAHLLSVPRSRAGPVDAAQSDRVPEMPSRRLVASALIRPMAKLRVRSLRRRHLHPSPCRLPSRSEPARCLTFFSTKNLYCLLQVFLYSKGTLRKVLCSMFHCRSSE